MSEELLTLAGLAPAHCKCKFPCCERKTGGPKPACFFDANKLLLLMPLFRN
jgi:hypothetical protein